MEDDLCILLICISCFIITCLIIELIVVNIKRLRVKQKFLELDDIFEKRLNILSKMVDIAKGYERNQFDDFGSRLYDYSNSYTEYDCNKKIEINELIDCDINRLLLIKKVYPELNDLSKYIKLEKQLIRYSKVIKKLKIKYNKVLDDYNYKMGIFPRCLFCNIFYKYDYFRM